MFKTISCLNFQRDGAENDLSMESIYGSGKATQEADNVLLLQSKKITPIKSRNYIQVVHVHVLLFHFIQVLYTT